MAKIGQQSEIGRQGLKSTKRCERIKIQKLKAERVCPPDIQVFYCQLTLGCFQSTEHIKTDTRKFGFYICIQHTIWYPSDLDEIF